MSEKKRKATTDRVGKKKKVIHENLEEEEIIQGTQEEKEVEAGIIQKIRLDNFMCHKCLEIDFHNCINIINGENGSGKSAIITGLQLCLGSKASKTNRAESLKQLIKEGEDVALITVHLRNEGKDAYRPKVYGKTIIIERRIDKSSGHYRIKDENGKVQEKTRQELQLILNQFNIHIDNPCTIMTQDVSRKFLGSTNGKDKYDFFLGATQLQKMLDDFDLARQNNESSQKVLNNKQTAFEVKKQEFKSIQQEYDDATKLQEIGAQMDHIRDEIAWAIVREKEEVLKKFEEKLETEKLRKEGFIQNNAKNLQNFESYEEQRLEAETKLTDATNKLTEASDLTTETTKKISSFEKQKTGFKTKISDSRYRINVEEKNVKKYERKINETAEKVIKDRSAEVAAKEKALKSRQERLEGVLDDLKNINENLGQVQEECEALFHQHSERQGAIDAAQRGRKQIQSQIDDAYGQQKSKYRAYPKGTQELLQEFSKRKREFQSVPIGPIGMLTTLRQMKWASGVQSCIRAGAKIFIVHSYEDEKVVKKICQQKRIPEPSLLIFKHTDRTYQISSNKLPSSNFLKVLDVLDIDTNFLKECPVEYDPKIVKATILNALIDQSKIESTILIEDRKEASDVMFGSQYPQNVSECITINGTRLQVRGKSHITQGQNVVSTYWVEDYSAVINDLKQKLKNQEKVIQAEIDEKEKIPKTRDLEKKMHDYKIKKSNKLREREQLTREIKKIENEQIEEEEVEDNSSIIQQWKDVIEEKKQSIKELKRIIENEEEKASQVEEELQKIYTERESRDFNISKQEKLVDKLQSNLEKIMKEQVKMSSERTLYERNLKKHERDLALLEGKISELKTVLEVAVGEAKSICEKRIETTQKSDDLIQKRETLNIRLQRESAKLGGSVEEIKRRYFDQKKLLDATEIELKKSALSLDAIQKSLKSRHNKWSRIRSQFSQVVSHKFNDFLAERGHSGSVEFDHEAQTMEIQVILESSKQFGKDVIVKDTKSLSGGERSYSTVSLLLALWEVVDSPFRALDEFDIFMDAIYRKESMDLLLKVAKRAHSNRQLIILTPHDTSQIKLDKNVKILKLKKPQRNSGQTILDQYVGN
eukprot:gene7884-12353_t